MIYVNKKTGQRITKKEILLDVVGYILVEVMFFVLIGYALKIYTN